MEYKDYYKIMGLSRDASQEDIRLAYRKRARKYHPDVSKEPDAEARFKEVNEAYEVLKDKEKRAAYDQLGSRWQAGQEFRPPPDWENNFHFEQGGFSTGAGAFSDFFESLFGGNQPFGTSGFRSTRTTGHKKASVNQDQHTTIEIPLESSYLGQSETIHLQQTEQDAHGHSQTRTKKLQVKIPRGITEGQQIRLPGQGIELPNQSRKGDIYLKVHFKPHKIFNVKNRDIYLELPITPWEAALGASVIVPTLGGKIEMKIPAGSQSAQIFRLKGRGLPGNPVGDQHITLKMVTPEAKDETAKAFYQKMSETLPLNPRNHLW
ncbi:MAG: DnaJ C-terminal domain-containing protein [Gammaproteobacteria bacterium]